MQILVNVPSITITKKLIKNNKGEIKMIYMWQEERGKSFYRFQTDEREIRNRMKRREKFKLVADGVNCSLWIYQATAARPDIARKMLKTLSGSKVNFDSKDDIFYSEGISSCMENSAA